MMKMPQLFVQSLLAVCLIAVADGRPIHGGPGSFSFPNIFNDHMVLQKAPLQAVLWGYAAKIGGSVEIYLSGKKVSTTKVLKSNFSEGGVWFTQLQPVVAGGPYNITASGEEGEIVLNDVLFGDVWVCSGQSNMQFLLNMSRNGTLEVEDAKNYPEIRVFTVARTESYEPQYEFMKILETWSLPNNRTVNGGNWSYFSAVCWLYGKYLYQELKYPIGLIATSYWGTPIEAWSSPDSLKKCGIKPNSLGFENEVKPSVRRKRKVLGPTEHSVLYNAMIHPLLNLTIYGAIWYQGESNANHPDTYNCTFPGMIDDWREKFFVGSNGSTASAFPFGFVQLAPNRPESITHGFPDIRWHQTADYGYVPNPKMYAVFMAVAMDLPDFSSPFGSVHPRDKEDVAKRLVLSGLAVAYRKKGFTYAGPFPTFLINDVGFQQIYVEFDGLDAQIDVRNNSGFEICCSSDRQSSCSADEDWVPAPVATFTPRAVKISYKDTCSHYILGVRYAWRESPCLFKKCAVYGHGNDLPAPPFVKLMYLGSRYTRY